MKTVERSLTLKWSGDERGDWISIHLSFYRNYPGEKKGTIIVQRGLPASNPLSLVKTFDEAQWHEALQEGIEKAKVWRPTVVLVQDYRIQRWAETTSPGSEVSMYLTQEMEGEAKWHVLRDAPGQPRQTLNSASPSWEGAIEAARAHIAGLKKNYPAKEPAR